VRVRHPLGAADRIAFDQAVDDLSAASERCAVHWLPLNSVCSMLDKRSVVNGTAYMDFKKATDALFSKIDHQDLASRLGISVAAIRQARLRPDAAAHRSPPKHWPEAVIRMAERRIMDYRKLIEDVRGEVEET
jgi:uncharacterized protein YlxP (DUF503 family)